MPGRRSRDADLPDLGVRGGPLRSGVQVDTLLEQHGFLRRKRRRTLSGSRRMVASTRKNTQAALQRWLPDALYYRVNHGLKGAKALAKSFLAGSDIDWSRTQAFSRGKEGTVFINLKGRDPHGSVEPGAPYEAVRERLIECFAALRDPATGEPAVERVYRAEELYQGPMLGSAPDLVIAWRDDAYMPTEDEQNLDSVFVPRWREYMNWPTSGSHRRDGVLVAHGPGVRRGATVEGGRIVDLAPTWLHGLGLPVPAELEGRVLAELFEPGNARSEPALAAGGVG